MKCSIAIGIAILSVFIALCFCVAFAEKEITSKDNASNFMNNSMNISNTTKETGNVTESKNASIDNTSVSMQEKMAMNATPNENVTGNVTNPFAKARGSIECDPECKKICTNSQGCYCRC